MGQSKSKPFPTVFRVESSNFVDIKSDDEFENFFNSTVETPKVCIHYYLLEGPFNVEKFKNFLFKFMKKYEETFDLMDEGEWSLFTIQQELDKGTIPKYIYFSGKVSSGVKFSNDESVDMGHHEICIRLF
jgi:hypothetical protein